MMYYTQTRVRLEHYGRNNIRYYSRIFFFFYSAYRNGRRGTHNEIYLINAFPSMTIDICRRYGHFYLSLPPVPYCYRNRTRRCTIFRITAQGQDPLNWFHFRYTDKRLNMT